MNPHTRVQNILQKLRSSDTPSFDSDNVPKYNFGAFQTNTRTASQRGPSGLTRSFTGSHNNMSMVGGGKSVFKKSSNQTEFNGHSTLVWLISVVALGSIFLVVGQWVDSRLADDSSEEEEFDYSTLLMQTGFQIILNMSLLLVPFILLQHYGPNTLLYKYYFFLVFPLWVIALLGQPLLKTRLKRILEDEEIKKKHPSLTQVKPPAHPIHEETTNKHQKTSPKLAHTLQPPKATSSNIHEGFIRSHTRYPAMGRLTEYTSPGSLETTVDFKSPLLPSHSKDPFEFHGHGSEAQPRHTSLDDLFG